MSACNCPWYLPYLLGAMACNGSAGGGPDDGGDAGHAGDIAEDGSHDARPLGCGLALTQPLCDGCSAANCCDLDRACVAELNCRAMVECNQACIRSADPQSCF